MKQKGCMIVDSGVLISIATSKWIERYLKEMEVKKDDIIKKEYDRRFKMGENFYYILSPLSHLLSLPFPLNIFPSSY